MLCSLTAGRRYYHDNMIRSLGRDRVAFNMVAYRNSTPPAPEIKKASPSFTMACENTKTSISPQHDKDRVTAQFFPEDFRKTPPADQHGQRIKYLAGCRAKKAVEAKTQRCNIVSRPMEHLVSSTTSELNSA